MIESFRQGTLPDLFERRLAEFRKVYKTDEKTAKLYTAQLMHREFCRVFGSAHKDEFLEILYRESPYKSCGAELSRLAGQDIVSSVVHSTKGPQRIEEKLKQFPNK